LYIVFNDSSRLLHFSKQQYTTWPFSMNFTVYTIRSYIYMFIRVLRVESSRSNDGTDSTDTTDGQSRGSWSFHAIVTIVWSCLVIGLVTAAVAVVYSESNYQVKRFYSQTSREKCTVSRASLIGDDRASPIIVPDNAYASTRRSWHCRIDGESQLPAAIRIWFILA